MRRPGSLPQHDPRGLIFEAYRMSGLSLEDCRTIFLDWALGMQDVSEYSAALSAFHSAYCLKYPGHPMTSVIEEGMREAVSPAGKRGRHSRRQKRASAPSEA